MLLWNESPSYGAGKRMPAVPALTLTALRDTILKEITNTA